MAGFSTEYRKVETQGYTAICEECHEKVTLTTVDPDGVLIGDECQCGYYVTRYMPGMEPR